MSKTIDAMKRAIDAIESWHQDSQIRKAKQRWAVDELRAAIAAEESKPVEPVAWITWSKAERGSADVGVCIGRDSFDYFKESRYKFAKCVSTNGLPKYADGSEKELSAFEWCYLTVWDHPATLPNAERVALINRSKIALACLPDAPYRDMLEKLHTDMLAADARPQLNLGRDAQPVPMTDAEIWSAIGKIDVYSGAYELAVARAVLSARDAK